MATALSLRQNAPVMGQAQVRVRVVLGIATAILVLVALINVTSPPAVGVLIALAALTPWIIASPIRGLQVLLAAAIAIELDPLGFPDSLTDRVPFFTNLDNSLGLSGISVTPAELLMVLILVLAFTRAEPAVRARLVNGRLFRPYLLFLLAVLMGEIHGLLNGGDLLKSLWEVRPQLYGFVAFVAASLLIRSRQDIVWIAAVAVAAILLKGAIGDFRYFVVLSRNLGTHEAVLGHEDSFFLALMPMGALAAFIWQGWSPNLKLFALACPVPLVALLVNQRRAGIGAMVIGVGVVILLAIRFNAAHRRRLLIFALIGSAIAIAFLITFWNDQYGVIGQLVRPIRSQIDPTYRDYLSNLYRQAENVNLQISFQTNKLIGMGFGMPFLVVVTQADISTFYPLWNYIPHNTLFWVGVRMGLVGSVAFWGLIGIALLEVCRSQSVQKDRFVLTVVALAGGAIAAELLVAYADLQLESYRNMIFMGVLFGVLNVIPALFPEPAVEARRFV